MLSQAINFDTGDGAYHVVNGAKGSSYYTGSTTITAGTAYNMYSANTRGTTFSGGVFYGSGGYPGGKTGVYSNLAGVAFDTVSVQDQNPQQDLLGRWEGTKYQITSSGSLALYNASGASGPLFMKNLRLQKFQTTFSFNRPDTYAYQRVWFAFNGTDQDNYDMVSFTADGSGGYGPETYSITNDVASWVSGTTANCPACGSTGVMWCRVQFDGTTLKAWALVKTDGSTPSETDWSTSATQVASVTSYRNSGGKIGFAQPDGGDPTQLSNVTIKSYKNSTSAWVTEAVEDFSVDGSGFANGNSTNLASDSNGNQTFDGTQVYTYDAWNRLTTVSHGYRDSSNNLQHGQAAVTCSYDAKGRRITKAIANTGSWDCTYNYYYKGDSTVEEQNGSGQTIKQFVWGTQYIDELIQTSLNSSPTTQSICDTPYWVEQDANWNVLGIVNSSGVLTERYEYGAYGQRTPYISAGSNDTFCTAATVASTRFIAGSTAEPWGLCEVGHQGLMHDEESGLIYNRDRIISGNLAHFLQRDPECYGDSMNLVAYELLDPITNRDPSGRGVGRLYPDPLNVTGPVVGANGSWYFSMTISPPDITKGIFGNLNIEPMSYALDKNKGICCTKIGIIQLVERHNGSGSASGPGVYPPNPGTGDIEVWHIDSPGASGSFYQNIPGIPGSWGNVCGGIFSGWSSINDDPSLVPGQTLSIRDYAVCNDKGSNQGKVFDGIQFSAYTSVGGNVTTSVTTSIPNPAWSLLQMNHVIK